MTAEHFGEKWKTVEFLFEYTNESKFEISNFGRIRSYNKLTSGNIINGSMINGYRIIKPKFFKPRDKETQLELDYLQKQVFKVSKEVREMKLNAESSVVITEAEKLSASLKQNLKKKFADDTKSRTINWQSLYHRLVAEYFLEKPSAQHTIVAHIDYQKLNNKATNLKWMTPEENYEHQKSSPYVIHDKLQRRQNFDRNSKVAKLSVTRVMLLKKMLNQGKPMKQLVRFFKVTETQISRIKRGENWRDIEAAK